MEFNKFILPILICMVSISGSYSQASITVANSGGYWATNGTWSPSGVPGNDEVILIDAGDVVVVNGTDHTMNSTILVIRGELIMRSNGLNHPSLIFTGDGGVVVEDGGKITDEALVGDASYIRSNGTTYWSGGTLGGALGLCTINCGEEVGDYESTGETAWPSSLANPLPVTLLSLNLEHSSLGPLIKWSTVTEINNSHFEIERSSDGVSFTKIGEVGGNGTYQGLLHYSYTDQSNIENSVHYYRLKQVDFDGQFEYFKTLVFAPSNSKFLGNAQVKVFPSTFTDKLTIQLQNHLDETIDVMLINMNGGEVLKFRKQIALGADEIEILALTQIAQGTYILRFARATLRL